MRLSLIGARSGLGALDRRVSAGPDELRRQGLAQLLARRVALERAPEWIMVTPMDEPRLPKSARAELFERQLEAVCRRELSRGALPVVIGGDRSCARASLSAAARRSAAARQSFGALWIDARLRAHTAESSPDSPPEDRALADLLGRGSMEAPRALEGPRLCALGARSHEEGEESLLRAAGAKIIWADPTSPEGLARDFQEALRFLGRSDALAVSVGLGVLDRADMPAAGFEEPNGLRLLELISAARSSARRMREPFCLIEVSDYNPALAPGFQGAQALCELIAAFLGH